MSSSNPETSAMRSAYRSSLSRVVQNALYEAEESRLLSTFNFTTASERGASPAAGKAEEVAAGVRICGGRRCNASEKSGEGKTVRALTRMFVMVSSRVRCGLNW